MQHSHTHTDRDKCILTPFFCVCGSFGLCKLKRKDIRIRCWFSNSSSAQKYATCPALLTDWITRATFAYIPMPASLLLSLCPSLPSVSNHLYHFYLHSICSSCYAFSFAHFICIPCRRFLWVSLSWVECVNKNGKSSYAGDIGEMFN